MEINGAKMFVKALQEEGVDTLFAYPGGTAIDLFDALYDAEGIDMILPRHEQALVHAADGYARSTPAEPDQDFAYFSLNVFMIWLGFGTSAFMIFVSNRSLRTTEFSAISPFSTA